MKAVDLFSKWALIGRDKGMERNHMVAVEKMLSLLFQNRVKEFSFIDIGCGNGYVVRKVFKHPLCYKAMGIDGAEEMIKKAKLLDSRGEYILSDITKWKPIKKVNFIHSMEVMYYLDNPKKMITDIKKFWLKRDGMMIMGIDFYYENKECHSWPKDLNVPMKLYSISEWLDIFRISGLNYIQSYQENRKGNFSGTLIISGINSK